MRTADAVVVGGGVIGCSVAYHLARAGTDVVLLERGELAGAASGAAAGMLLPVGEADAKGAFLSFGLRSLALFPDLVDEVRERSGIDPEYEPSGALHVADSEARARRLRAKARDLADGGTRWLDAAELRARAPQLGAQVRGALWSPREGHVRSPLLTRALAAAAQQLGTRVETGVEVLSLLRSGGRVAGVATSAGEIAAESVVLCTGAWTQRFAAEAGGAGLFPLEPVRGQIVSLASPRPAAREILVGGDVYLVPKRDGSVVAGATEERVGFDDQVTAEGVSTLLRGAFRLAPELADCAFLGAWSGLRPATPDGLPLIGPVPGASGLYVAAGHFRNGVLLSAVTGRILADCVVGRALPDDAQPFSPERFASG